MTEEEQLAQACVRLGASAPQARVMAAQLLKRAEQLSQERGLSRMAALAYLMELLTRAHGGGGPGGQSDASSRPESG